MKKSRTLPSYLIVFHANLDPNAGTADIGDDPCFDAPPSWGICRPNYRRSVPIGANLFFLGYVAPNQYFVKGWFQVGEKISYIEACDRFPNRRNVIISPLPNNQPLEAVIRNRQKRDTGWRYPKKQAAFANSGLPRIPEFLFMAPSNNQVFIQNPADEHEIDNWKCNRIFHCSVAQFRQCMNDNVCLKERNILQERYSNYIVAREDMWLDVGPLLLSWDRVENEFRFNLTIRTPRGQHNVRLLPGERVQALIDYLYRAKNGG